MTDIRKGDLIKATRKGNPGTVVSGRARAAGPSDAGYVYLDGIYFSVRDFTYEVLDRAIDEELLIGAIDAGRRARGLTTPTDAEKVASYRAEYTAVINFVNEYNSKEIK